MKFSLEPSTLYKALRDLPPRREARPHGASNLRIEATVGGLLLETDRSDVFLRAQVATTGVCVLSHENMILAADMCSPGKPITIVLHDGWLDIGPCRVKVDKQPCSLENDFY
jgi:hypothetical protein